MILEMTAHQIEIETGTDPLESAIALLRRMAQDNDLYLQLSGGYMVLRCRRYPLYKRLVPTACVSLLLAKGYIEPDGDDDRAQFWLTDSGRQAAGGER